MINKSFKSNILPLSSFVILWFLLVGSVFVWNNTRPMYNGTDSMPIGWYLMDTTDKKFNLDKIIIIDYKAPPWVRKRDYAIPHEILAMKRVKAVPGDQLKIDGRNIYRCTEQCDLIAVRLETDTKGRQFPPLDIPEIIPDGMLFAATDYDRGFDSRYLGLISFQQIVGTAKSWHTKQDS